MKEKENIADVVILGAWNKYILSPDWVKNNLFPDEESIQFQLPLNIDASLKFTTNDLTLGIIKDRFEFSLIHKTEPVLRKTASILRILARLLPHTPIVSIGINNLYVCSLEEAVGHVDFEAPDIKRLAAHGTPLQMQGFMRQMKIKNHCVLNLRVQRDENAQEVVFDFNYDYSLNGLSEVPSILGDEDDILWQKRLEMQSILREVYGFTEKIG